MSSGLWLFFVGNRRLGAAERVGGMIDGGLDEASDQGGTVVAGFVSSSVC